MKRAILAACLFAATPAAAQEQPNRFERIKVYATLATLASVAANVCDGVEMNPITLSALKMAYGITPADDGLVNDELDRLIKPIYGSLEARGRLSWCAYAWKILGPGGSGPPGLLMPKVADGNR